MSEDVLPIFSSGRETVSCLIVMSVSYFELILVRGIRVCSNFTDLYAAVQLYQYHLLKRLPFPTIYSWLLCHRLFVHRSVIPGLSILLHQSVCLFFCRDNIVLITVAFFSSNVLSLRGLYSLICPFSSGLLWQFWVFYGSI